MSAFPSRSTRVIVPGEAPFGPAAVLVTTLLAGVAGGGYLAGLNWERFYRPERKWPTIAGSALLYLVIGLVAFVAYAVTALPAVLLLGLLVNAAAGIGLVYWQRHEYGEWVAAYGLPTREQTGLRGVLLPLGVVLFVQLGILFPLATLNLVPAIRAGLPRQTIHAGDLTLTAGPRWRRLDVSGDPVCQQPDTRCLVSLRAPSGSVVFDVIRVSGEDIPHDVEAAADALWEALSGNAGLNAELAAREQVTLGGLPAVSLTYSLDDPYAAGPPERLALRRVLVLQDGALYRFTAIANSQATLHAAAGDINAMLDSVTFGR